MPLYRSIGIDLGVTTTHEVAVMEPGDENPRAHFRVETMRSSLEEMLSRAQVDMTPGMELRFIMEPTDTAWLPVAQFLHGQGYAVYLVKAEMVQAQRKVWRKYAKTDRVDAVTLATLPWAIPKALHRWVPRSAQLESLRRRVKQSYQLGKAIGERKLRIEAWIRLALPVGIGALDLFKPLGQLLCRRYLNPSKCLKLGLTRLQRTVERSLKGADVADAVAQWYRACEETVRLCGDELPVDYEDLQDECNMEFSHLQLELEQHAVVQKRVAELYQALHPSRNLETVYGVGPIVAASCVAAIGDPTRFATARQFRAFTGMIPKVSGSGQHEGKHIPISKAGPNWLKRNLFLAAESGRQWDPELAKIYYDQMVTYGHHHKQAVCAVAAHLADRIFVVYRDDRPYVVRDLVGNPVTAAEARAYIHAHLTVPESVRKRLRRQNKGKHKPRKLRAS